MQLRISVPDFCFPEAKYSLEILFRCIAFDDFCIEASNSGQNFEFTNGEGQLILTIENHFFIKEMAYSEALIPKSISFTDLTIDDSKFEIVHFYGESHFSNHILKTDIISSTFFMASRWEESVIKERDQHGRFDENRALAVEHKFITRPVINEYANLLKSILQLYGTKFTDKEQPANIQITFDIDYMYKWKTWKSIVGNLYRKGPTWNDKLSYIQTFLQSKILGQKEHDPFFSFPYLMETLSKLESKAIFYFMANDVNSTFDYRDYDLKSQEIQHVFKEIIQNGHEIGLHSSFNAFDEKDMLQKEKNNLEVASGVPITSIRAHYLKITPDHSLCLINEANFTKDSSMMYACNFGFRCGATIPIPYFDLKSREVTNLKLIPTIAMSSVGINTDYDNQYRVIEYQIGQVKNHGGHAQVIWHNSDLDTGEKKSLYQRVIKKIAD